MHSPFCHSETHVQEFRDVHGHWVYEAVSMLRKCVHDGGHYHDDFDAALKRFNPILNLGYDMKKGRYVVYRFTPSVISLKTGLADLPRIQHCQQFMDILLECKWLELNRLPRGGIIPKMVPRPLGNWVFNDLASFAPKRFELDDRWVSDELKNFQDTAVATHEKDMRDHSEAWVNDCMSIADRGNPAYVRTAVRVPEKTHEPSPA